MKGQKKQWYRLYQLRVEETRAQEVIFRSFNAMASKGYQEPPAELYDLVYEGELLCPEETDDLEMVERLFAKFNIDHPDDFQGRSLSVYIEIMGKNHPVGFDGRKARGGKTR